MRVRSSLPRASDLPGDRDNGVLDASRKLDVLSIRAECRWCKGVKGPWTADQGLCLSGSGFAMSPSESSVLARLSEVRERRMA